MTDLDSPTQQLINLIIDARIDNAEMIDQLVADGVDYSPVRKIINGEEDTEGKDYQLFRVAEGVARKWLDVHHKDLSIDVQGHNRTKPSTLSAYLKDAPYSEFSYDNMADTLIYPLAKIISNIPGRIKEIKALNMMREMKLTLLVDIITGMLRVSSSEYFCGDCGKKIPAGIDLDTMTIRLGDEVYKDEDGQRKLRPATPCPFPNGIGEHTATINIPSGKLVIANDLRSLLPQEVEKACFGYICEESGYYNSVNSAYGRLLNMRYWAKHGLAFISCGNTSPSIYINKQAQSVIFKNGVQLPGEKEIGYVCTDLWAVTAMDMDLFTRSCEKLNMSTDKAIERLSATVVDFPPGEYMVESLDEEHESVYGMIRPTMSAVTT